MDFKPNRLPVYTRQALLAEIKRVVAAHFAGLCPTHRQFNQFSRVHSATVAKEFGSWAEAMQAAGFEYSRSRARPTEIEGDSRNITPDLLMKELKSIAHKHNARVFQYEDYRRLGGKRARGTFCKYLGGWRQAVAGIGLRDGFSRPRPDLRTYTDEDYFAEMQRLWETLGRQPTTTEMRKYGKISPQSFQERFGSWIRAVYDFCQDRSRPDGGDLVNGVHQSELADETDEARRAASQAFAANPRTVVVSLKKRTPRKPSDRLRFRVFQRDNFTCRACGRSPARELGVTLEADHVHAWSRGGETTFENLQTLCGRCNSGKSNA
jgi:5-methylcytosine-specific restriction endonuclease McrA